MAESCFIMGAELSGAEPAELVVALLEGKDSPSGAGGGLRTQES